MTFGEMDIEQEPAYDAGSMEKEEKRRINAIVTGIEFRGKKQSKTPN